MSRDFTVADSPGGIQIYFCDVVNALIQRWSLPMVVIILLATGILSDLMRPILRVAEYALGFVLGL
jgi:hypothetical protein